MANISMSSNFEVVTDILRCTVPDFDLVDATLVQPFNANVIFDGEWMTFDPAQGTPKLIRASALTTAGTLATAMSFPVFAERGRSDLMARLPAAIPILYMGHWEANTTVFDASLVAGANGAAITKLLQPVKVATIAGNGRNYTGLVGVGAADVGAIITGYVTRLPQYNGGKLRIMAAGR